MPIGISPELQNQAVLQYYKDEFGTNVAFVQRVVRHADSILKAIGISDAQISLLNASDTEPRFGATRLPILITLNSGEKFVLKKYDVVDIERERQILKKIEGICGSKILVFAQQFFIEEYIDPQKFTSLESIAQLGQQSLAFQRLGEVQAVLARLGIIDTNTHLMDEVYLDHEGTIRVADVGHAHFIFESSEPALLEDIAKYQKLLEVDSQRAAFEYFKSILIFRDRSIVTSLNSDSLEQIAPVLKDLADSIDAAQFVQLCIQLRSILFAIKYFHQERSVIYPWKKASENFIGAVHAYCKKYLSEDTLDSNAAQLGVDKQAIISKRITQFSSMPEDGLERKLWLDSLIAMDILKINRGGNKIFVQISFEQSPLFVFTSEFKVGGQANFELNNQTRDKLKEWLSKNGQEDIERFLQNFFSILNEHITALYFSK